MRRSTVTAAALAMLAALAPAGTLHAQGGLISVGIGGGASMPQGGFSDRADVGWNAMATVALNVPLLPIGLRLDGAYDRFNLSRSATGATTSGAQRVTSLTINPVLRLQIPFSPITPYIIGGGGTYNVGCAGGAQCESLSHFGWNAGAGVRLGALGVKAFAEARYHRVSVASGTVQYVPVTIGVMF